MIVEYAIPSRERAPTLVAKTLLLLARLGVSQLRTRVFVAPDEMARYRSTLDAHGFEYVLLEKGALGVGANRNRILDFYEKGTHVVSIDDDMRDLVIRRSDTLLEPILPEEWEEVVRLGFLAAPRIFGLYPVPNPYFMKPKVRTRLCYIAAGAYGFVSDPSPASPLRVTLEDKEDFERSLQCYEADGQLLRFEYVSWRTEGYHGAGGMQADGLRTKERVRAATEELVRRFPGLCTLNETKKSGWVEPRLSDRRAR